MKGISTINARAETVAGSPTWREPFKKRRCLVPASAFYEWKKLSMPKRSSPYAFTVDGRSMFAFAGLWDAMEGWGRALAAILLDRYDGRK